MYKKEEIHDVIKKWNELYEKIYEIVKLHGEKDDVYYDITDVNQDSDEGPLLVQVEFYKWQDNNDKLICIEIELLTNEESFNFDSTHANILASTLILNKSLFNCSIALLARSILSNIFSISSV